jgi:hypothetical protein
MPTRDEQKRTRHVNSLLSLSLTEQFFAQVYKRWIHMRDLFPDAFALCTCQKTKFYSFFRVCAGAISLVRPFNLTLFLYVHRTVSSSSGISCTRKARSINSYLHIYRRYTKRTVCIFIWRPTLVAETFLIYCFSDTFVRRKLHPFDSSSPLTGRSVLESRHFAEHLCPPRCIPSSKTCNCRKWIFYAQTCSQFVLLLVPWI